jgi:hypothetical protein
MVEGVKTEKKVVKKWGNYLERWKAGLRQWGLTFRALAISKTHE